MEYPVTQLWDSRVLYIYALLGGFVELDEIKIMNTISRFVNHPNNRKFCLDVLIKLERDVKIEVLRANPGTEPKYIYISRSESKLAKLQQSLSKNDSDIYVEVRAVDAKWFQNLVTAYLKVFQAGLLFVPVGSPPVLYAQQKTALLFKAEHLPYMGEVHGRQEQSDSRTLETLLTMSVEGLIKIKSLTFRQPIRNANHATIYAKIEQLKAEDESDIESEQEAPSNAVAQVKIEGRHIYVGFYGEEPVLLTSYRTDSGKYTFMRHLNKYPQQDIHIKAVRTLYNCEDYADLTEVVRKCGFNATLKDIFFENLTKSTVKFVPTQPLSPKQATELQQFIVDRQKSPQTAK